MQIQNQSTNVVLSGSTVVFRLPPGVYSKKSLITLSSFDGVYLQ
jgi:hypothetical protein